MVLETVEFDGLAAFVIGKNDDDDENGGIHMGLKRVSVGNELITCDENRTGGIPTIAIIIR